MERESVLCERDGGEKFVNLFPMKMKSDKERKQEKKSIFALRISKK